MPKIPKILPEHEIIDRNKRANASWVKEKKNYRKNNFGWIPMNTKAAPKKNDSGRSR